MDGPVHGEQALAAAGRAADDVVAGQRQSVQAVALGGGEVGVEDGGVRSGHGLHPRAVAAAYSRPAVRTSAK